MQATLTIRDETTFDRQGRIFTLDVLTEQITVRELIRSRVYQEVKDFNTRQPEYYRGLVQPGEAEQTLNGFKLRKRRQLDWERQFEKAIEAFRFFGFIILVDNHQVSELDEVIEIKPETTITFLKLIPLVGG